MKTGKTRNKSMGSKNAGAQYYYDEDAKLGDAIKETVAIIGYGIQGRDMRVVPPVP